MSAKSKACCRVSACVFKSSMMLTRGRGSPTPNRYWSSSCHRACSCSSTVAWEQIIWFPCPAHHIGSRALRWSQLRFGLRGGVALESCCCGSDWGTGGACNSACSAVEVGRVTVLVVDTLTILIRGCDTNGICILLLVRALGSVEVFGTHTWPGFCCWCVCAAL